MSEYEPGTVAMATVRGVPGLQMFRYSEASWVTSVPIRDTRVHHDEHVTDVRPLVVIDPEDREQTARLADAFCDARWSHLPGSDECDPLTRHAMREALAAYLKPPKPPEPTGDGAVVEDVHGYRWVRIARQGETHDSPPWRHRGHTARRWEQVNAVRVLSEGVSDA